MKRRISSLGEITETVYIELGDLSYDAQERLVDFVTDFCIDRQGNVRKGQGMVAPPNSKHEYDPEWVPSVRWGLDPNAWNAHSDYLELELPNPAENVEFYKKIRLAMHNEINRRLSVDLRKLVLE